MPQGGPKPRRSGGSKGGGSKGGGPQGWGSPKAPKPRRGFTRTTREPKRAHLRVLAFQNTTKIQREDTQRGKKRTNFAAGEEKSEILGGPGEGRSWEGRSRGGRSEPNLETNTPHTQHTTHNTTPHHTPHTTRQQSVLAKVGHNSETLTLATVSRLTQQLAKVGLAKVGHDLPGTFQEKLARFNALHWTHPNTCLGNSKGFLEWIRVSQCCDRCLQPLNLPNRIRGHLLWRL